MPTREGNSVYSNASPFRVQNHSIVKLYGSRDICKDCKHLGDLCQKQDRVFDKRVTQKIKPEDKLVSKEDGIARSWVSECKGFEPVSNV